MKQRTKWLLGAVSALVVLMIATIPDQASHLRAIRETAALKPQPPYSTSVTVADYMNMI